MYPHRKLGLHTQVPYYNALALSGTPQHPMTPMDFTYSHSMLPANLLSTPSPYVGNGNFLPPASPSFHPRRHFLASNLGATTPIFSPHQAHFELQLPRTVVFSGLSGDVSVRQLLDLLEYGPVEQCRIERTSMKDESATEGEKESDKTEGAGGKKQEGPSDPTEERAGAKDESAGAENAGLDSAQDTNGSQGLFSAKSKIGNAIYVSFLNHPTALYCLQKCSQSEELMQKLTSPNLKVAFDPAESKALKPKTLSYVAELDASRAISIRFKILDLDLVPLMEKSFKARCVNFGELDDFKATVNEEDLHIEFVVHFLSVENAIKIYDYHKKRISRPEKDDELQCISVVFCRDRCDKQEEEASEKEESENELSDQEREYPYQVPYMQVPSFPYNPDPVNDCNRTLCLGNLQPKTTVEEIANNVRAGGLVESIKYYRHKRVCFITFVDAAIALKFYLNHQVLHQLVIRDHVISVNWGRNHSGPLAVDIAYAVSSGASRNVYIGLKLNKGQEKPKLPDEATLRADFSHFGEMEQINYVHNKDCGFMNFMNIADAIRVVNLFETDNKAKMSEIMGDEGEFYEKYRVFKISFGKDRCGNPLKFSFKKSIPNERIEDYDRPRRRQKEEVDTKISEEAAMVFGIQTNQKEKNENVNEDDNDETEIDGEESDSDIDDVSIIIESEPQKRTQKSRKKTQKVYHNSNLDLTELLSAAWSSAYGYGYGYQQMYYQPASMMMTKGYGYDVMPQMIPYYANQYGNYNYGSGSQIMAEYLAKSQHENALLASAVQESRRRRKEN